MTQRSIQGLPPSFHETFAPDRRHVATLLKLAMDAYGGNVEAISAETGIPTGKSSGKVVPHLKYAQAMGLIEFEFASGIYALQASALGRAVFAADPLLHEPMTQVLMHLMLTRAIGGASVWHVLFGNSRLALGKTCSIEAATTFLAQAFANVSAVPGPLFTTYREDASLARTGMLATAKGTLTRGSLPMREENYWCYAYVWLQSWERSAGGIQQLPLSELEERCGFVEISGWSDRGFDDFLAWASAQRIIRVDRQTGAPLVMKTKCSDELIEQLYSDML